MVAYSFRPIFQMPILTGRKRHTMRDERRGRSRHARVGEELSLWQSLRAGGPLLGRSRCVFVMPVRMDLRPGRYQVRVGESACISAPAALDVFAGEDGFASWAELVAFWRRDRPQVETWEGVLIEWAYPLLFVGDAFAEMRPGAGERAPEPATLAQLAPA